MARAFSPSGSSPDGSLGRCPRLIWGGPSALGAGPVLVGRHRDTAPARTLCRVGAAEELGSLHTGTTGVKYLYDAGGPLVVKRIRSGSRADQSGRALTRTAPSSSDSLLRQPGTLGARLAFPGSALPESGYPIARDQAILGACVVLRDLPRPAVWALVTLRDRWTGDPQRFFRAEGPEHTSPGQRPGNRGCRRSRRADSPTHRAQVMPQSLSLVLIHVVFSTKDRRPVLTPPLRPALHAYLAVVSRTAGCAQPGPHANGRASGRDPEGVLFRGGLGARATLSVHRATGRAPPDSEEEYRQLLGRHDVAFDERFVGG